MADTGEENKVPQFFAALSPQPEDRVSSCHQAELETEFQEDGITFKAFRCSKCKEACQVRDRAGRPAMYSQELAAELCARIAEGKSLRSVCRDEDMPSTRTFFRWIKEIEAFRLQYARACEERTEAMAEEILDIVDDGRNDWMEVEKKNGESMIILDKEAVMRSKLRFEARQWLMSKMKPKRYGDKLDVTSAGEALKGNTIIFKDFKKKDPDGAGG